MRRRSRPDDPVPAELREFRVESWEVLVDGEPSDDFIRRSGGTCPIETWRRIEAQRLWGDARSAWAREHGWPGGTVARLREDVQARRAARQRREDQDATG